MISTWKCMEVEGPDAEDFLHRICTAHVKSLVPGRGCPANILDAQGRFRASFYLWRLDKNRFCIEADLGQEGRWQQDILSVLDHFHFGEKISFKTWDSLKANWLLGPVAATMHSPDTCWEESGTQFFRHPDAIFQQAWVSVWSESSSGKGFDPKALERARILALSPRVSFEINADSNPLELGWILSLAPSKGCYPGQEVIERVWAKGEPARRLVLLSGSGKSPTIDEVLLHQGKTCGQISSYTLDDQGWWALALVKKLQAKADQVLILSEGKGEAHVKAVAAYR